MPLHKLLLGACLAGAILSANQALAQVNDPADADDMKQIFRLLNMEQTILSGMHHGFELGNQAHPEHAVDVDTYLSFVTYDTIDEHFAPIYARYMSKNYAKQLIPSLKTPGARLSLRLSEVEHDSGFPAARAMFSKLSHSDQNAVNALRNSNPYKSFANAQSNSNSETRAMFDEWSEHVMDERAKQVRKQLAEVWEAELQIEKDDKEEPDTPPPTARINRTGMRAFDQEVLVTYDTLYKVARLSRRMTSDTRQLNLDKVLSPANLVTKEGLEASNLTVLTAENLFDSHRKAMDAISADYDRAMAAIPMTPEMRAKINNQDNKDMTDMLDIQLREAEHLGNWLEIAKQILNFCEGQLGKISVKDGVLQLNGKDQVQAYNTLIAKLHSESDEIKKVDDEDFARRQRSAERMKNSL